MSRTLALCLAAGALLGCGGGMTPGAEPAPIEIVVPAPGPGVVQAAVDRVADGGTVVLGPGTYRDPVEIEGKIVHLVGATPTGQGPVVIEDPGGATALVTGERSLLHYGPRGGGSVVDMVLRGGAVAIRGRDGPTGTPAQVTLERVSIEDAGEGVVGSFAGLHMHHSSVTATLGDAVAVVLGSGDLEMLHGFIENPAGVGILVYNVAPGFGSVVIADTQVAGSMESGIVVVGAARPLRISNCTVNWCQLSGILLVGVDDATVEDTTIQYIFEGSGPTYQGIADGLVAADCAFVDLAGCEIRNCVRSGLMFYRSGGRIRSTACGLGSSPTLKYGLVVQESPMLDYDDSSNEYHGSQENLLEDGALPVPDPPPVPDP